MMPWTVGPICVSAAKLRAASRIRRVPRVSLCHLRVDADALQSIKVGRFHEHASPCGVGREALEQIHIATEASDFAEDGLAIAVNLFIGEFGAIDQPRSVEPSALKTVLVLLPQLRLRRLDFRPQEREHDFIVGCPVSIDHRAVRSQADRRRASPAPSRDL
jgi:hypothetical protein